MLLALTLLLVALNAFFVAAEFALVKIRISQVELKIASGSSVAKLTKNILDHLDSYLSATQLGITLASLALGWIGEPVFGAGLLWIFNEFGLVLSSQLAHTIAFPLAFVLLSILHIVFGELAPRAIAIRDPEQVAYALSLPLRVFFIVFRPFVWFLNSFANVVLRLFGISAQLAEVHSREELEILLAKSSERGAIRRSSHELIERVFSFEERTVRQIMIPRTRIRTLDIDSSWDHVIDTLVSEGYSRMPISSGTRDNIVGILYAKDVLKLVRHNMPINIKETARPAYFVPETKKIGELLREFQSKRNHMAIVVNEFGSTVGLVTLEDIVEELVGEIQDEYDEELPVVEMKSETEFVVNAMSSIIDVNKLLPVPLPESDDFATVSGLISSIFGTIPEVNEKKVFGGYEFTILKRSRRRVEVVLLTLIKEEEEKEEDEGR